MTVLSFLGLCMMTISSAALINIDAKQKSMDPKPMNDNEHESLIIQWVFNFGLGVLGFIIGMLI